MARFVSPLNDEDRWAVVSVLWFYSVSFDAALKAVRRAESELMAADPSPLDQLASETSRVDWRVALAERSREVLRHG